MLQVDKACPLSTQQLQPDTMLNGVLYQPSNSPSCHLGCCDGSTVQETVPSVSSLANGHPRGQVKKQVPGFSPHSLALCGSPGWACRAIMLVLLSNLQKKNQRQSFSVHSTPSFHPEASGALRLHPSSISNGKRPAQEPHVIRKSNWKGNLWPSGEPAPLSALGVGGAYLTQRHTQEADASILCGQ